jgi:hypothetical protein
MPLHEQEVALLGRIASCESCAARNLLALPGPEFGVIITHRGCPVGHWHHHSRHGFQFHASGQPGPTHTARDFDEAHVMTVGIAALNHWK